MNLLDLLNYFFNFCKLILLSDYIHFMISTNNFDIFGHMNELMIDYQNCQLEIKFSTQKAYSMLDSKYNF